MTGPAAQPPTDEWLVERCLAHEEEAWYLLLQRYGNYIYAIALRGFRLSEDEAEEVFQETVLSLFQHLADFRGTGSLRAWIGSIAQNACRQHIRRRGRRPELAGDVERPDEAQEAALQQVETGFLVQSALEQLGQECREVLTQFFYGNRKYADIAASLGIAEGTVASRIARCLMRLRALLRSEM